MKSPHVNPKGNHPILTPKEITPYFRPSPSLQAIVPNVKLMLNLRLPNNDIITLPNSLKMLKPLTVKQRLT